MYNYIEQMMHDILAALPKYGFEPGIDRDDLTEQLNDLLWTDDSVTGNASGSYTFNRWRARDYVLDNMDILQDMAKEFDAEDETGRRLLNEDWEWCDVSIRCYLLPECIEAAANEALELIN